ncbi:MAG: OmpA family protein [Spirochaetes bacterium]|nr:OmpA family protein [Spirochaetota bacterium]
MKSLKYNINRITYLIIFFIIAAVPLTPAAADIIYWPSEYNSLYNEKVALELELKSWQTKYENETANLQARIKELENEIANLNDKLAMSEKMRDEDKKVCGARIKELENVRDILNKKGGDREKELMAENKRLQDDCQLSIKDLRDEMQKEREASISELASLRQEYEKKIADLKNQTVNLNTELANIKKLSEAQKQELDRMSQQAEELEKQLADEIKNGDIRLKRFNEKLIINIDDKISFDSGSAKLKDNVLKALDKISAILSKYSENNIIIEGHTDNVPIIAGRFSDNWQLSTERALSVLRYLLKNASLDPLRVSAAGYGEFHPIVSNDTPENRSLNRRVDIVVVPRVKTSK